MIIAGKDFLQVGYLQCSDVSVPEVSAMNVPSPSPEEGETARHSLFERRNGWFRGFKRHLKSS